MSECSGPQTLCQPDYFRVGSTGPAISSCELKIEHDEDRDKPGEGEICFRGRHIMSGYLNNDAKTREAIDDEGWLHSGDVGRVDAQHLLYITGRIKELIITAGGENIAPVPIEDTVKKHAPAISNCVLIGDRRKYNTMLVTLRTQVNPDETFSQTLVAGATEVAGQTATTVDEARADPAILAHIQAAIDTNNAQAVSRAQKVQYFHILDGDFSRMGTDAELGPTLKLKRPVVVRKYADQIEAMYRKGYDNKKQR